MIHNQFKKTEFYIKNVEGVNIPYLNQYPEELSDSWIHICETPMHRQIAYIVSFYHNTDNPKGTIIYSHKIYNKYPDMFITLDKNFLADRMYTNPKLRKRGYWKWAAMVLRPFFYNNLNKIYIDGRRDRAPFAEKAYLKAASMLSDTKIEYSKLKKNIWDRDPVFPYIWYNQTEVSIYNEQN